MMKQNIKLWDGEDGLSRDSHKVKVAGSNPAPATIGLFCSLKYWGVELKSVVFFRILRYLYI